MRLNRRAFIFSGATVAGFSIFGSAFAALVSNERLVADIVRRHLTFPGIGEEDIIDFAHAYVGELGKASWVKVTFLRLLSPILYSNDIVHGYLPEFLQEDLGSFERTVFTEFILSTNLLDESRAATDPVSYLGYYDPHEKPCAYPLTQV